MNGLMELKPGEYPVVYDLYNVKKQHIPALSVLLGNYPGRVFTDHTEAPTLAIVWATGRWMYAAGDIRSEINRVKLETFLQTVVVPDCRHRQEKGFEVYTDDHEGWTALFTRGLAGLKVDRHLESVYEFNWERFSQRNNRAAADSLDAEVTVAYEAFPLLGSEVHDESARDDRFAGRTGTGAVLKVRDQVVSICKNNGFIVGNRYFIDVDTYAEAERGKGYATLAAASLINHYLAQGMIPLWETTHENIASHKLALRLGFEPVESYPVFAFVMEGNSTC